MDNAILALCNRPLTNDICTMYWLAADIFNLASSVLLTVYTKKNCPKNCKSQWLFSFTKWLKNILLLLTGYWKDRQFWNTCTIHFLLVFLFQISICGCIKQCHCACVQNLINKNCPKRFVIGTNIFKMCETVIIIEWINPH